jgi:dienelactone hydrolase
VTYVLLFHHALGLTSGCHSFAERLVARGHDVHVPDLYEGETFPDVAAGVAHAEAIGFDTIIDRGRAAAEPLPARAAYIGLSLGVLPAQSLAQTRSGARGAVFISAAVPPSEFGGSWPAGLPLQIHMMDGDALVVDEGDLAVARELADSVESARLWLYPGDRHLFVEDTSPDYDAAATELVIGRIIDLLDALG